MDLCIKVRLFFIVFFASVSIESFASVGPYVSPRNHPSIVKIIKKRSNSIYSSFLYNSYTGTFITPNVILTAAHGINQKEGKEVFHTVKKYDFEEDEYREIFSPYSVIPKNYLETFMLEDGPYPREKDLYDFGVLILKESEALDPLPIWKDDFTGFPKLSHQKLDIIGYGQTGHDFFLEELFYSSVKKTTSSPFFRKTDDSTFLRDHYGVWALEGTVFNRPMKGDSGAALLYENKILGILASSSSYNKNRYYMFNSVTSTRLSSWLQNILDEVDELPGTCCHCQRDVYRLSDAEKILEQSKRNLLQLGTVDNENYCQQQVGKRDLVNEESYYELTSCHLVSRSQCKNTL